jgi:predicted amidohydrolase YtcJ
VAVHCVTRLQLVATAAALAEAGPRAGDRIEHAGVVPPELRPELCRLGVTVVTQPNFVSERGDAYLREVDTDDVALLYPCASLQAAGIAVAAGTDAPFGDPDPWAAMRAAVHRRTPAGAVLGDDERIDAQAALDLFLGHPDRPGTRRRIARGAPADLCVLDRPLDAVYAALAADPDAPASALNPVAVTLAAGSIIADNR